MKILHLTLCKIFTRGTIRVKPILASPTYLNHEQEAYVRLQKLATVGINHLRSKIEDQLINKQIEIDETRYLPQSIVFAFGNLSQYIYYNIDILKTVNHLQGGALSLFIIVTLKIDDELKYLPPSERQPLGGSQYQESYKRFKEKQ